MTTASTEPLDIADIPCTLHRQELPALNSVSYLVHYPGGITSAHRGSLAEDDGTLRRAVIAAADIALRVQYAEWESTLV